MDNADVNSWNNKSGEMNNLNRRGFLRKTGQGALLGAGFSLWARSGMALDRKEDYLSRLRRFDEDHPGDEFLSADELPFLRRVVAHLKRAQSLVGYGNFGVIGFDRMLRMAGNYPQVQRFTNGELEFLERIFELKANRYGFFGEKVLDRITSELPGKSIVKIPGTGQYLLKGKPFETRKRIERALGEKVVLTSGVRGIVKQMYLFLSKAERSGGNLSRASRSLAPPGYSFHGIGDFDVGQRGLGRLNFTRTFSQTEVYRQLVDKGFAQLRYPEDNLLGVRYEPWHIRVV